jgi:hypothetical protein
VDTVTACAVHLDDTGRLTPLHVHRLDRLLGDLEAADGLGVPGGLSGERGRLRAAALPLAG